MASADTEDDLELHQLCTLFLPMTGADFKEFKLDSAADPEAPAEVFGPSAEQLAYQEQCPFMTTVAHKTLTKRALIGLYCRGLINAKTVVWCFSKFDLKSA